MGRVNLHPIHHQRREPGLRAPVPALDKDDHGRTQFRIARQ
jgi:hypothetical protein